MGICFAVLVQSIRAVPKPKIKSCLINREMPITNIDEIDKDMLLRQSRILYPEVEDWLLNLAIEAYENSLKSPVIEEEPMIEIN